MGNLIWIFIHLCSRWGKGLEAGVL